MGFYTDGFLHKLVLPTKEGSSQYEFEIGFFYKLYFDFNTSINFSISLSNST